MHTRVYFYIYGKGGTAPPSTLRKEIPSTANVLSETLFVLDKQFFSYGRFELPGLVFFIARIIQAISLIPLDQS